MVVRDVRDECVAVELNGAHCGLRIVQYVQTTACDNVPAVRVRDGGMKKGKRKKGKKSGINEMRTKQIKEREIEKNKKRKKYTSKLKRSTMTAS